MLRTELNFVNRIEEINMLEILAVTYNFNKEIWLKSIKLLTGLMHHPKSSRDWMIQLVHYENARKIKSIKKESDKFTCLWYWCKYRRDSRPHQEGSEKGRSEKHKKPCENKTCTVSIPSEVDLFNTHQWQRGAGSIVEIEGLIMAAQNHSLFIRNYQANILRNRRNPNNRFCNKHPEAIDRLISVCSKSTLDKYKNRRDRVGQ